jgi:DNA (cytosine-5)-methyltransferase 1
VHGYEGAAKVTAYPFYWSQSKYQWSNSTKSVTADPIVITIVFMRNTDNRLSASLFAGAGFGDMGFESAGFEHVLLCEIDSKRTQFAEVNFPKAEVLTLDVAENVDHITEGIRSAVAQRKQDELFLLYATPPCQGMSKNGIGTILKAMSDGKRPVLDKRNRLYLPVVEVVKRVKPRWIFFENVCRLFNFKDIDANGDVRLIPEIVETEFHKLGYVGKFEQVQMADYGLPQTRLRAVGLFRLFEEGGVEPDTSLIPKKVVKHPSDRTTLRQAIGSNESLDASCSERRISTTDPLHRVPKWRPELHFWMNNTPEGKSAFENNRCHNCNHLNEKPDVYCQNCEELLPKPTVEKAGVRQLIKGFVSAYKRMYWDKPASTITTRSAYACSDHKVHPEENRVLSILEIAVLQGIDVDRVQWCNPSGKQFNDTLLRELIGECVPPLFADQVGKHIDSIERSLETERDIALRHIESNAPGQLAMAL